jgi:hypothetical protein
VYAALEPKQKKLVDNLKDEWKQLWSERLDDKVRAEGIALKDYTQLFVEKGTVIHATRDYKTLNFKEILEKHQVENAERYIPPNPHVGGWAKFVKTNITPQKQHKREVDHHIAEKVAQQSKKNGRGWLHK